MALNTKNQIKIKLLYFSYSNTPFVRWDSDRITAWMNEIGLNMYLVECRKYVKNGDQLLKFSLHELEKVRYMTFLVRSFFCQCK